MSYFDRKPAAFRILASLVVLALVGASLTTVYNYASSPTDENWFRDTPSTLYITKSFLAVPSESSARIADSIQVGDLLLAADERELHAPEDVTEILKDAAPEAVATFKVYRPTLSKSVRLRVSKRNVPPEFFMEIPRTAHVFDVIDGGASDRAGMKVGDLIVRINGLGFRNANEADRILRRAQIGKTITYEVYRGNEVLTLHVTLAHFGIPIALLAFALAGFVYTGVGAFIALKRPGIKAARLVGVSLLMIGYFITVLQIRRDVDRTTFTILRDAAMVLSMYFGAAISIHSGQYFPRERPELIAKRWIRYSLYGLTVALLVLVVWRGELFFFPGILVLLGYGLVVHLLYRKQRTEEYKKLSRVITWAGVGTALLVLCLYFIFVELGISHLAGLLGLLLSVVPLAYLYTIGRFRLLDIQLRVRRNIQYTLVTAFWVIAVVFVAMRAFLALPSVDLPLPNIVLTGASIEITDAPPLPAQRELVERIAFMLLAIGMSYGFWKLGGAGQRLIDRKYYRTQYDYRRAAHELAEVLATKLSMIELARGIVEKMAELMQLKRAGVLFFRDQAFCCCQEAYGFDGTIWKEFCLKSERSLLTSIQTFHGEFRVDYLPPDLKENFRSQGFQYLVPIRSKERVIGTILVGEKLSEATFDQEDFSFLSAAARQASLSIENAFLYEELAEKERMKHELEIARRIQLASLPQSTPVITGLDISGISVPAFEVGGDFFDYLDGSPQRITIVVGDVSGKGTSAALYMSKVQGILRSLHGFDLRPGELFVRANHLLCKDLEKKSFVTVLGAEFYAERKSVQYARAGHLPLLYYDFKTRNVETMTPRGLGLGLNDEDLFSEELKEESLQYKTGDVLLFVTDGVTEARNSEDEQFGEERIIPILKRYAGEGAEKIRDQILEEVKKFSGDVSQHDDQTIVVVKAV